MRLSPLFLLRFSHTESPCLSQPLFCYLFPWKDGLHFRIMSPSTSSQFNFLELLYSSPSSRFTGCCDRASRFVFVALRPRRSHSNSKRNGYQHPVHCLVVLPLSETVSLKLTCAYISRTGSRDSTEIPTIGLDQRLDETDAVPQGHSSTEVGKTYEVDESLDCITVAPAEVKFEDSTRPVEMSGIRDSGRVKKLSKKNIRGGDPSQSPFTRRYELLQ